MSNVFGRDCINFSTLFYHGTPFMCGFDGVDYTNLKTLINHQWQGQGTLQRIATANDVEYKYLITQGDLSQFNKARGLFDAAVISDETWEYNGGGILGSVIDALPIIPEQEFGTETTGG